MKPSKLMLVLFLGPALLAYAFLYIYPLVQTFYFGFNEVSQFAGGKITWLGMENYRLLLKNPFFQRSMVVFVKWWLIGGAGLFGGAFFFTILFMMGLRFKGFWRAVLYGPNIINVVAMTTMWSQYIYSSRFGLFKQIFSAVGITGLAEYQWTATENLLTAVLIAYIWGSIGYFFLFVYSGVERIPIDLYEVARIDGANTIQAFFRITLPLLRDVIRVALVMWSITAINMFAFPITFAPVSTPVTIITPPIYLYRLAFGTAGESSGEFQLGKAAAGSVLLLILVVLVAVLLNLALKEKREIEY